MSLFVSRIQSSVSSHPTGFDPTRPRLTEKPPERAKASRRKDILAPIRLRTGPKPSRMPRYVQPTTQSNSGGNQAGRPVSQSGITRPPTPTTAGSS